MGLKTMRKGCATGLLFRSSGALQWGTVLTTNVMTSVMVVVVVVIVAAAAAALTLMLVITTHAHHLLGVALSNDSSAGFPALYADSSTLWNAAVILGSIDEA